MPRMLLHLDMDPRELSGMGSGVSASVTTTASFLRQCYNMGPMNAKGAAVLMGPAKAGNGNQDPEPQQSRTR